MTIPRRLHELTEKLTGYIEADYKFEIFFENAPLIFAVYSGSGHIMRVNKEWCFIMGYGQQESVGKSWMDLIHPDDLERSYAVSVLNKQGKQRTGNIFKNRYRKKDGEFVTLNWYFTTRIEDLLYTAATVDNGE